MTGNTASTPDPKELDLPLPAERSELELPPGNSVTPPPIESSVAISGVAEDQGNNQGILLPLILIILAIYFFGPTSWRNFLRTAKDNILEEVKITAAKLQNKKLPGSESPRVTTGENWESPGSIKPQIPTKSKLAYNKLGKATVYDFENNQESDLGVANVTSFLWSEDGKLAALVQGEYGGSDQGLHVIPQAHATTAGFDYLLYLLDLNGGKPKLLLPRVFGQVIWSPGGQGLYYTEDYYNGRPLLLGNQAGLRPTEQQAFFVNLNGIKQPVSSRDFELVKEQIRIGKTPVVAAAANYDLVPDDRSNFEKIVDRKSKVEFFLREPFYTRSYYAQWSPDGRQIAYLYRVDEPFGFGSKDIFTVISDTDLINKHFPKKPAAAPSAESVFFRWLDEATLIVMQLNRMAAPGYYLGNLGKYDVATGRFDILVDGIKQTVPYSEALQISPDRALIVYQEDPEAPDIVNHRLVVIDLTGAVIKQFPGRDPSWSF